MGLTPRVYWASFNHFPLIFLKWQLTHTLKAMQLNAWHVQLHELSQSGHTQVITTQPIIPWTIGASKEMTSTCSGQKPRSQLLLLSILQIIHLNHQQVLSALTFKIHPEPSLFSPSPAITLLRASIISNLNFCHSLLTSLSPPLLLAICSPCSYWSGPSNVGIASCYSLWWITLMALVLCPFLGWWHLSVCSDLAHPLWLRGQLCDLHSRYDASRPYTGFVH